ncbi:Homeodomain-like DNA binding domain-containing transcription factor, partial [Mucor lusitanicus CBS 277.49]
MLAAFARKYTSSYLNALRPTPVLCQSVSLRHFASQQASKWLPWEDKLLQNYVKHNGKNWNEVAEHCLPTRTPSQCRTRWTDALDPELKHGPFSKAEKELLQQGVAEFGPSSWAKIAAVYLPWRTRTQIRNHYRSKLDPAINKEKWTEPELDLLLRRTIMFGQDWNKVAEGIRGRTPEQCSRVW